jgi:hypothetical protein
MHALGNRIVSGDQVPDQGNVIEQAARGRIGGDLP